MTKLSSRKFWAWIVATIIFIMLIIFVKEAVPVYIPWWGGITIVYIGFQALIDFIPAVLSVIKAWKSKEKEDE